MLVSLQIENLATFREATVELSSGLNILSGTSGAGKSVLLRALALTLGTRFDRKFLGDPNRECIVSALYAPPRELLNQFTEEFGECEEGTVLISRRFRPDGRSISTANGRLIALDHLKRFGDAGVRILSQDESLGLRESSRQLRLLDQYCENEKCLKAYANAWEELCRIEEKISELKDEAKRMGVERQMLEKQLEDLEAVELEEGMVESLREEVAALSHAGELVESAERMCDAAGEFCSVLNRALPDLMRLFPPGSSLAQVLNEGRDLSGSVEEWSRALSLETGNLDADPARADEAASKLSKVQTLIRKYGRSEDELIKLRDELQERLGSEPPELRLERLEDDREKADGKCRKIAEELHKARIAGAKQLGREVSKTLELLDMKGDRFQIEVARLDSPTSTGLSAAAFLIRPTVEKEYVSVAESASGGERSRVLLALCAALGDAMASPLLVFDEIDTSMGSRLGKPVAEALKQLSAKRQVLCVTHLAPVAAGGSRHLYIEKNEKESAVRPLEDNERLEEIAQMIAGEKESESALKQAAQMLGMKVKGTVK